MITTTLRKIRDAKPCQDGWKKLYKHLGGIKAYGLDTPITFQQIIESNGIDDALWCLCTVSEPQYKPLCYFFEFSCAKYIEHIRKRYTTSQLSEEELVAALAATKDWQTQRLIELTETGHWSPVVQQD